MRCYSIKSIPDSRAQNCRSVRFTYIRLAPVLDHGAQGPHNKARSIGLRLLARCEQTCKNLPLVMYDMSVLDTRGISAPTGHNI